MALSKTQNNRLGLLLSVMFNEDTPEELLVSVVKEGFVEKNDNNFHCVFFLF